MSLYYILCFVEDRSSRNLQSDDVLKRKLYKMEDVNCSLSDNFNDTECVPKNCGEPANVHDFEYW